MRVNASMALEERFLAQTDFRHPDGCWQWVGAVGSTGYGRISAWGKDTYAHRVSVRLLNGLDIPRGFHVDHVCRNPRCVNPAHLEVVTPRQNTMRQPRFAEKTHCAQGHPWTPENQYVRPNGGRMCLLCHRFRARGGDYKGKARKLTPLKVREIRELIAEGVSQREIGRRFGIAACTVSNINTGKLWAWLR